MSIDALLSVRGDASGAVAELRKISEGLGQVREKGTRAGSGISEAIGALSSGLMKFQFVVAGISTAFELLKAGAAVAKTIWDRWGISPSVKAEIKWLEQQRKANAEWEKTRTSGGYVRRSIELGMSNTDVLMAEQAAEELQKSQGKNLNISDESVASIADAFISAYKPGEAGLVKELLPYGMRYFRTGDIEKDRLSWNALMAEITSWTSAIHKANRAMLAEGMDLTPSATIDYNAGQWARENAKKKAAEAAAKKPRGGGGGDDYVRPTIDWTIRPDIVKIEAKKIEFTDLSDGRYDPKGGSVGQSYYDALTARQGALADSVGSKIAGATGQDSKMEEWRSSLTTGASAFGAFSDALATGVDAAISGQEHLGKAMLSAAASSLRAKAVEATVMALWETAKGISASAIGDPGAAAHFTAAGKYAAVAVAAGAGSALLGHSVGGTSAGAGGSASAPAASHFAGNRDEPISITINIGHGFVGSERDLGDEVYRAVNQARRGGRAKEAPRWE